MTQYSTTPRWNLRAANWETYTDEMEINTRDTDITTLTDIMLSTAVKHVPTTKPQIPHAKAVPWWNKDCEYATLTRNRERHRHERYKTQQTLESLRRAQARCHKVIRQAKADSWSEHVNQFNRFTPLTKIWNLTKTFTNNKQTLNKALLINHNNNTISDPQQITNLLADHYHNKSAQLPSTIPLTYRKAPRNEYDNIFTMSELNDAIANSGNTSTGPDKIHYAFIRHLGPTARTHLLNAFNKSFTTNTYPQSWFHAHIISIPKQNKDHTNLDNFRPISLTSCIHKTFERMVKNRLQHYITKFNHISPIHSGFLPGRNTTDNLTKLTADIQLGLANKQCTTALFLDIKNAYDTVNTTQLLQHIHKIGIRGHLGAYLSHYLTRRTFQTKYLTYISETKHPTTGLMQGSILSPLLFVLALNSQIKRPPPNTNIAIYADDIAIWCTKQYHNSTLVHLQGAVNTIQNRLETLNLKLSPHKTQCITFGKYDTTNTRPLQINNIDIPFSETAKFLGITFDKQLTFRQHIMDITSRAQKRMNVLRALSGTTWGGDRKTLTLLYQAIIRPILEYGAIIFENAAPTHLKKMDTLQNQALRTVTGALRTTPISALHVYNNTQPLHARRTEALFRYFHRIQLIPKHPCIKVIKQKAQPKFTSSRRSRRKTTMGGRLKQLGRIYNITLPQQDPRPHLPKHWTDTTPKTHYLFTKQKSTVTEVEAQQLFLQFIRSNHIRHTIFTDGSKHEHNTGAATVIYSLNTPPEVNFQARLPNNTSIYTAELFAIYRAYLTIQQTNTTHNLIATDSKSAITALQSRPTKPTHPLIHHILQTHFELETDQQPTLLWIPGHCGIPGNNRADRAANEAAFLPIILPIPLAPSDFKTTIRQQIDEYQQECWSDTRTALRNIHPTIRPWTNNNFGNRTEEKIMTRLRTGHTRITHNYIIDKRPPPNCATCKTRLTIRHILLDCAKYETQRGPLKAFCTYHRQPFNLTTLLGDYSPDAAQHVLDFIHHTDLTGEI